MQSQFIEKEILYDGTQLKSHWIYRHFGIKGDALVSFMGGCDVKIGSLVDLEDQIGIKPIFSRNMLHFIIEHFDGDLEKTILRQRLFMALIQTELEDAVDGLRLIRKGDDLYEGHFKLSVSIATASPVSTLIHTGVNIISEGTPVPTKGLFDFDLNPQAVACGVMNRYLEEMAGVAWARCKVRGVL